MRPKHTVMQRLSKQCPACTGPWRATAVTTIASSTGLPSPGHVPAPSRTTARLDYCAFRPIRTVTKLMGAKRRVSTPKTLTDNRFRHTISRHATSSSGPKCQRRRGVVYHNKYSVNCRARIACAQIPNSMVLNVKFARQFATGARCSRSSAVLTLVNDRCSSITIRWVSTVSTSARMLRSTRRDQFGNAASQRRPVDPGEVVVAAVPRQHHIGARGAPPDLRVRRSDRHRAAACPPHTRMPAPVRRRRPPAAPAPSPAADRHHEPRRAAPRPRVWAAVVPARRSRTRANTAGSRSRPRARQASCLRTEDWPCLGPFGGMPRRPE